MIGDHQLKTVREYVGDAFKPGMAVFPHFTLHGIEHLSELDRLAQIIGRVAKLDADVLSLVRLAGILHDFAMVDVPSPGRERELREKMEPGISFADVVRKTHQDEIVQSFSQPPQREFITSVFKDGSYVIEDAVTVARYHRYHPLANAPEHLRGHCALMRLIDELDIGPLRAPLAAYVTRRERMDPVSKLHWLKHICTRPIKRDQTLHVSEAENQSRVLTISVAILGSKRSWRALQRLVLDRLRHCLDNEGANAVLSEKFHFKVEVVDAKPEMCGETLFLDSVIRDDLESLVDLGHLKPDPADEPPPPEDEPPPPEDKPPAPSCEARVPKEAAVAARSRTPQRTSSSVRAALRASFASLPRGESQGTFRLFAVPPEKLHQFLCKSSRLSVIGNEYVPQHEHTLGGTPGAPSRFYVGPADSGKTRAAAEWISSLTANRPSAWVVLRPDMGTIPEDLGTIVLNDDEYSGQQVPQKAVLFLDDLPDNLPSHGSESAASDAVRRLFAWFHSHPSFRERHVVGTIRAEEVYHRPDWPECLPSLGHALELVQLEPMDAEQLRRLWEGMVHGRVFPSQTEGMCDFSIDLEDEFLKAVANQPADPEAIASFIYANAVDKKQKLTDADAELFSSEAVQNWLNETWPAIDNAYGIAAGVFLSLARFLEADLRAGSGVSGSLRPVWQYHEAFGADLCRMHSENPVDYMNVIDRMGCDGHAVGKHGERSEEHTSELQSLSRI